MSLPAGAWVAIAVGAVIGAWSRYALALWLNDLHRVLPMGTLLANIAGGLMIGFAVAWLDRHPTIDPLWRLAITTGFLGALTTFSTFSLEAVVMLQRGQLGWAFAHSALHLAGSIGAVALGIRLANG